MLLAMLAAWVIATVAFTRTLEQRVENQIGNAANVITRNGLPLTTELLQRVADLQQAEIALLEVLLRSAGQVVPREELAEKVLGRRFSPYDRSIDVHVSNLRRKLADRDGRERIKTVRGVGYQFATG